ncbi:MAG: cache domain-containing protein [Candidatus Omnitrophica bacterium]|nr:cache domain-containing protein [Candidatus Omnitrophota bacterium]
MPEKSLTGILVDKINELVFGNEVYKGKPVGTVTIFQDDIRISTNVLNDKGERAVGTRVSKEVYDRVVIKGISWKDRAFVVTDWYFTTYEPIKDISGNIIGILYVGILEKPYADLKIAFFCRFLNFCNNQHVFSFIYFIPFSI